MFKSAYEQINGIVYLPRMLEKIRMHAQGKLPEDYIPYLGVGFDGRCVEFLGVNYESIREIVIAGASDHEVFSWCQKNGQARTDTEKLIWNEIMVKRGWRDTGAASNDFLAYKQKYGFGDRGDIQTYFDFFDADEGRPPTSAQAH